MFLDESKIYVEGGRGGNGCVAFRREKFVPRGGPSGGDGGRGGSVILRVSPGMNTLSAFRYRHHFRSTRGSHGEGSNRHGRGGADLVVDVPAGTVVVDADGVETLADLVEKGQTWRAARGGRGGRGNARFATSVNQAPRTSEDGEPGENQWIRLQLKLLADVGLVGFPNAGKSSLLARMSAARPRVADYPFTTLTPVLGVVSVDESFAFVMADIPGLIEGAHQGQGLGTRFLRHVERTRVLVHVVDLSPDTARDPIVDLEIIGHELEEYSPALALRPRIVALNKMDLRPDPGVLQRLHARCAEAGQVALEISAATGQGLDRLVENVVRLLQEQDAEPVPEEQP